MKKRIPLFVIGVWAVVLVVAALSGLAQATVNCSGVTAYAAGGSYTVVNWSPTKAPNTNAFKQIMTPHPTGT